MLMRAGASNELPQLPEQSGDSGMPQGVVTPGLSGPASQSSNARRKGKAKQQVGPQLPQTGFLRYITIFHLCGCRGPRLWDPGGSTGRDGRAEMGACKAAWVMGLQTPKVGSAWQQGRSRELLWW